MPTPWGDIVAAGAQIVGGVIQSNSAENAKDAQIHSQMQATQTLARATDEARTLQGPGVQAYYAGLNAQTQRLGLPTQGVQSAIQAGSTAASTNWGEYGAQNPDVAAEARRAVGAGEFASENDFYRWHYQTRGQNEGRQAPTSAAAQGGGQMDMSNPAYYSGGGGSAGAPAGGVPGTSPGTFGNSANPAYTQPASYQAAGYQTPTFDKTYEAPTYQAPADFSFSVDSFKDNPAYKFAMEQGSGQVLASAAATGALQSGAALKRLQDRGQQTAYSFYAPERDAAYSRYNTDRNFGRDNFESDRAFGYGQFRDERGDFENDRNFGRGTYEDDRNFGYGQSIDDRNFGRGVYESDRGYLTSRYDRYTDDLARYTAAGQGAVTTVTNAALGQGSNAAAGLVNIGNAQADNAATQGGIWSGVAGNIGGMGASYLQGRGGAGAPAAYGYQQYAAGMGGLT